MQRNKKGLTFVSIAAAEVVLKVRSANQAVGLEVLFAAVEKLGEDHKIFSEAVGRSGIVRSLIPKVRIER